MHLEVPPVPTLSLEISPATRNVLHGLAAFDAARRYLRCGERRARIAPTIHTFR